MLAIGVIPARYASTRFPGKMLADLNGKPLIQHVWERVKKSKKLDDVLIACDDVRIFEAVKGFGGKAVLTSVDHISGTDRIAEAVCDIDVEIVVNIQGDEPLIDSEVIDSLVDVLLHNEKYNMATVIKNLDDEVELNNSNVVKVVIDKNKDALYFSRAAIPFAREKVVVTSFKHLGIYAYRKSFLMGYRDLPSSNLEQVEKLEQLRALEAGFKIKTILTRMDSIGVDTPEDLEKVKQIL